MNRRNSLSDNLSAFILILCACLMSVQNVQAQMIDILLKGGHVIDPKNHIDSQMDVAIIEGKIFQVAPDISVKNVKKV